MAEPTMGDWRITFEFANRQRTISTPLEQRWAFEELRSGFWITRDFVLCPQSQGVYWIPPSRLIMIERVGA